MRTEKEDFKNKAEHMIVNLSNGELSYQESVFANDNLEKDLENELGDLVGEDVELKILRNNGHIKSARYFTESNRFTNSMDLSTYVKVEDCDYIVRIFVVQTRTNIKFVVEKVIAGGN